MLNVLGVSTSYAYFIHLTTKLFLGAPGVAVFHRLQIGERGRLHDNQVFSVSESVKSSRAGIVILREK